MEYNWQDLIRNLEYINVDSAKHYTCREGLFGRPHKHNSQFHITYLVSGRGKAQVNSSVFSVRPADLVIIRPRDLHLSINDDLTNYELLEVKFSAQTLLVEEMIPNIGPRIRIHNVAVLVPAMERLVTAKLTDMSDNNWLAKLRLIEVLMLLVKDSNIDNIPGSSPSVIKFKIHQVVEHISVHYAEPLTLKSLSEIIDLSPNHFAALFKKVIGVSPIEFLIRRRLHHAKEMLETSDFSINQIAEICGFESSQYFSRLFSKREKITPIKFRKQTRKVSDVKIF